MRTKLLTRIALALALTSCHVHGTQDTLLIAGSSTMKLYLDPVVEAFKAKNPTASVEIQGGGAEAGIIALKREAIDVAMISRELTADEDDDNLRDYLVARDGVAIVVSRASSITGLTMKQLSDIASGAVTSWKSVGGPGAAVVFIDRAKGSHLRKSFKDIVLGGEDPLRGAKVAERQEDVVRALDADPNAISFVSFHRATGDLKILAINGVEMTRSTMLSGRYPLTRSFYVAVYMKPSKLAESFIGFAMSKEGQALLVDKGLLAVY